MPFTRRAHASGTDDIQRALILATLVTLLALVAVFAGLTPGGIASAQAASSVSGQVTEEDGVTAIEGIMVQVLEFNGEWWEVVEGTATDLNGDYTIGLLSAGTYHVVFQDPDGDYVTEYYDDATFSDWGQDVELDGVNDEAGVDASLAFPAAHIAGTLHNGLGIALPGISVNVEAFDSGDGQWEPVGGQMTDFDGTYDVGGLAGGTTYRVGFWDQTGTYMGEYYDDRSGPEEADPVDVLAGGTASGIDATLTASSSIAGRVTEADGVTPLEGMRVSAQRWNGDWWEDVAWAETDSSGDYLLAGFLGGTYHVRFEDPDGGFVTEFYDDAAFADQGEDIALEDGEARGSVNASLDSPAAHITGTVRDGNGNGIESINVNVEAYDSADDQWEWLANGWTDVDGVYDVGGLAGGSYHVSFFDDSGDYMGEYYDDRGGPDEADPVDVAAGGTAAGIDATLTVGASISGRVTSNGTDGIEGIDVEVVRWNGEWFDGVGWTQTDENGDYYAGGLGTGEFHVRFSDPTGEYVSECYNDRTFEDGAFGIVLDTEGEARTGVDATLASPAAHITGTVHDGDGVGLPDINVNVDAYDESHDQWEWVGGTMTNMDGSYDVGGLAGGTTYHVNFWDDSGTYVGEYYDDKGGPDEADSVDVVAGGTAAGIDATLTAGATIAGRVTSDAVTGIEGIQVDVLAFNGDWWEPISEGWTDGNGDYQVSGLAADTYQLQFLDPDGEYVSEYYDDATFSDQGDGVTLAAGESTTGVDAVLAAPAAHITGTVRNGAGTGLSQIDVSIEAFDESHDQWEWVAGDRTEDDGTYDIGGLAGGITYHVNFWDEGGTYVGEYYDDADNDSADPVDVAAGATASGIDATLTAGGSISGRVTSNGIDGVGPIDVDVQRWNGEWWDGAGWSQTDEDGYYEVGGLPTGEFRVRFIDPDGTYVSEFYNDQRFEDSAFGIVLDTEGESREDVNATLASSAGTIGGTVRNGSGETLSEIQVSVEAYDAAHGQWEWVDGGSTGDLGRYRLTGLAPGVEYHLAFWDESGLYMGEYHDDVRYPEDAAEVLLSGGGTQSIDATLAASATISGRVTSNGTDGIEDIDVQALVFNGEWWETQGGGETDASGDYTIGSLYADSYVIQFRDPSGAFVTEYYDDERFADEALPVDVDEGEDVTNVNAVLTTAQGSIAGTVRDENADPISGVHVVVEAYDPADARWEPIGESAMTTADGGYQVAGLAAGTYHVGFWDNEDRYADEYYDDAADTDSADAVTVGIGVTGGIDATLTALPSRITGTVRDTAGSSIASIVVTVSSYDATGHAKVSDVATVSSAGNGSFEVGDLPPGTYIVGYDDPLDRYVSEYYDDVASEASATVLWLTPNTTRSANATLAAVIVPPSAVEVTRTAGDDRCATAIAISKKHFSSAATVVLATGNNFPDALAAAPLAGSYQAPLLLVRTATAPQTLRDELARLGTTRILIVGGTAAVPLSVETDLRARGFTVDRIEGADRYGTAAKIAREVAAHEGASFVKRAFIARGDTFPDALAASPLAFKTKTPVLLVRPTSLPPVTAQTIADLGITSAIVAGSDKAVSDGVKNALGVTAERVSGNDRYLTASAIAADGVTRGWVTNAFVGIATGSNFPDALAGGAACGDNGGVLLLTPPTSLGGACSDYIRTRKASVQRVEIFGGTPAVSAGVETELRNLVR